MYNHESKKDTLLWPLTSPNIDRCSKFIHQQTACHPCGLQLFGCRTSLMQNQLSTNSGASLHFNGHFPGGWPILLKLRMVEVVVTTGAISHAKLQTNHHHQQINTQCFTGRMPFLSPNQQCQSSEGKCVNYYFPSLINYIAEMLNSLLNHC